MDKSLISVIKAQIFPFGSTWGKFVGARSFKFLAIDSSNYMLSFSLLLSKEQGEWNGQLHAWGFVGSLDSFLGKLGLEQTNPRDLFFNNRNLFEQDSLYKTMNKGLKPTIPSTNFRPSWSFYLPWNQQKTGFKWKFSNVNQWTKVEGKLYSEFQRSLSKNSCKPPKTFSTFTLSPHDPVDVVGIPDEKELKLTFGAIQL